MISSRVSRDLHHCKSLTKRWRTFATTTRTRTSQDANVPVYFEGQLEPNAPSHRCYVLLHASHPPSEFPSVYKTPLSQELQARARKWGGIINFSWFPGAGETQSQGMGATIFSASSGRLEIPHVSLENVDEVERAILDHVDGPRSGLTSQEVHIYVCTHGARDCRCGDRGRKVYDALVDSVKSARERDPGGVASRVRIGEVGHVGGHKFAANLLYFPQGEWLGLVKPEDAPAIVAKACEDLKQHVKPLGHLESPAFPAHWRGRMGLTPDEQKELHALIKRTD